jgi:hypothetical protein
MADKKSKMSAEDALARIHSIARGVVSPQYIKRAGNRVSDKDVKTVKKAMAKARGGKATKGRAKAMYGGKKTKGMARGGRGR